MGCCGGRAVLTQQATKCFQDKKYDMAATFYAKTSMSFEEITLKFVSQDEPEALRMYLSNKLDNISEQDETQVIPPVPSLFTPFRPYLAHFSPVSPRFLRVFTVSPRRFQRAPSRSPGPRDSGKGAQTPFRRPS